MDTNFALEITTLVVLIVACVFSICATIFSRKAQRPADVQMKQIDDAIARHFESGDKVNRERHASVLAALEKTEHRIDDVRRENADALEKGRQVTDAQLKEIRTITNEKLDEKLSRQSSDLRDHLEKFDARFAGFQNQIQGFQTQMNNDLAEIRKSVDKQLGLIREDNEKQLDRMRETVDEKLTKTLDTRLNASFKQVSDQLESVNKSVGDMQSIASEVGGLKRVLSNVKTRGILGEVQLGAILADILTSEQYEENVATKPGSSDRVEFAVKIPLEDGEFSWLPIDAKFPGDTYEHLRDAIDSGDKDEIAKHRKKLADRIKQEAKDIYSKYISVPHTTNFAIMFLPFEGLYAEVVDMPGLLVQLQHDYHVNVAGPSTMAAILNSLQMSYQSIAIQKKADEIQLVLGAVKTEFSKYQGELQKAYKQIETAGKTVNSIITTRTNVMERKLKGVTALEDPQAASHILGLDEPIVVDVEDEDDD